MKTVLYQNADWIITMDEERRRYRHADLLISGKEIKAIGKTLKDTLGDTVTIDEVVDARLCQYTSSHLADSYPQH